MTLVGGASGFLQVWLKEHGGGPRPVPGGAWEGWRRGSLEFCSPDRGSLQAPFTRGLGGCGRPGAGHRAPCPRSGG